MRQSIRKPIQKKVSFRPKSIPEFCKLMLQHFGIKSGNTYLDGRMMLITGKIQLDLMMLDDYFHEQFGEYEESKPEGMSMSELITEKYGSSANAFIKSMIG